MTNAEMTDYFMHIIEVATAGGDESDIYQAVWWAINDIDKKEPTDD